MTEERKKVVLTKEGLENDIKKEGLTRKQMADKYNIPVSQINKALKMVGLEKAKPSRILFEIAESIPAKDVEEVTTMNMFETTDKVIDNTPELSENTNEPTQETIN